MDEADLDGQKAPSKRSLLYEKGDEQGNTLDKDWIHWRVQTPEANGSAYIRNLPVCLLS